MNQQADPRIIWGPLGHDIPLKMYAVLMFYNCEFFLILEKVISYELAIKIPIN